MESITEATILGDFLEFYYFFKIIMNFLIPLVIFVGILIICYRLEKLNIQMEEQNEKAEALLKLGIVIKNRNEKD